MIMAPIISAITGFDGMPKVNIGMNDIWAPALLAASGPATPSITPLPNRAGCWENFRLQRVGREGGRATAGQDPERRPERDAPQDRGQYSLEVLLGRHQPDDTLGRQLARPLGLQIADD